jgi:hypothetical protein
MFIKVTTTVPVEKITFITIDKIVSLEWNDEEKETIIGLISDTKYSKESPEEIMQLIAQAKFSELVDQELEKPMEIKRETIKNKRR